MRRKVRIPACRVRRSPRRWKKPSGFEIHVRPTGSSVQNHIQTELDGNREVLEEQEAKYIAAVAAPSFASMPEPARRAGIFGALQWVDDPRPALRKEIACLEVLLARAQGP